MLETSLLAAFLGGILALLSPCSALLLPAFFAYSFQSPARLISRTVIFWLGLSLTLVPLGVGSSAIAALFFKNREAFITGAGTLVLPVVSVDGKPVGEGKPGPVATRLRRLYIEHAKATSV